MVWIANSKAHVAECGGGAVEEGGEFRMRGFEFRQGDGPGDGDVFRLCLNDESEQACAGRRREIDIGFEPGAELLKVGGIHGEAAADKRLRVQRAGRLVERLRVVLGTGLKEREACGLDFAAVGDVLALRGAETDGALAV